MFLIKRSLSAWGKYKNSEPIKATAEQTAADVALGKDHVRERVRLSSGVEEPGLWRPPVTTGRHQRKEGRDSSVISGTEESTDVF